MKVLRIALLLLIACRRSGPEQNAWQIRSLSTEPGGVLVLVILDHGHIAAPDTEVDAGLVSLFITNADTREHTLAAEPRGAGIDAGPPFASGHTRRVDVNLRPGRYVLYCPLPGHRQRGESATIICR